ncbi:unnamed protein product [Aspergillus oryzae]|uniref:Unnamed protein product n=2 Tax=Aspergillus oryzae TaxID=5062 RepID=A0AAN4YPV9_ASPOZ|nr:unnamed protein product [Aspergillus oryzae]GMF87475.1 unnamed protein product [Aspergillus oryzae]GMG13676.1 unnamed protein product [Aspergillus oryzae]GMG34866.1 unnamed protein product [Aspergillus oryzae]GMG53703.1 unnamed protein product [Aspergillus oryzae var. brunneus]
MSQSNDLANTLIIALKDRDIPFNCAEIKSAFTDEKEATENETWSKISLQSTDYTSRYTNLESTGSLQNIINNLDTNADRPFLDEDLRKAINSLNASTAVIQKQRRVLASQCDNIDKELRRKAEREVRRNTGIEHLRQRYNSERQRTSAGEVRAVLKIESENTAADSKRILSTLAAWLKEDDRALADLERLGSGIGPTGDDASVVKRTSELSTILAHYLAEEIQYRLDRVYLENLRVGQTKASQNLDGVADEVSIALERELESLYPEIDMLAEMRRSIQPTLAYTPSAKRIDSVSESHALAAVLRRTGLSSESVFHPEDDNAGIDVLFDARHHMFDCLQNYGIAADAPLVTELISSDQTTRLLSSSLNVNSHVKTLLTSDTHEAKLFDLQLKLEHVQKGVEMLDLGVVFQPDRGQETFVERWGLA